MRNFRGATEKLCTGGGDVWDLCSVMMMYGQVDDVWGTPEQAASPERLPPPEEGGAPRPQDEALPGRRRRLRGGRSGRDDGLGRDERSDRAGEAAAVPGQGEDASAAYRMLTRELRELREMQGSRSTMMRGGGRPNRCSDTDCYSGGWSDTTSALVVFGVVLLAMQLVVLIVTARACRSASQAVAMVSRMRYYAPPPASLSRR